MGNYFSKYSANDQFTTSTVVEIIHGKSQRQNTDDLDENYVQINDELFLTKG